MKKHLLFLTLSCFILFIAYIIFSPTTTPLSPSSSTPPVNFSNLDSNNYIIMGFAPYWNLKKLTASSLQTITYFSYFHLLLQKDGSLYTKINRYEEDPGYTNYKRLIRGLINYEAKPLILTFMPESQSALQETITTPALRRQTINTIITSLKESHAVGVNIDFEPLGETPQAVRQNFTLFIKELRDQLSADNTQLSVSLYPSSIARPRLWDLPALTPYVDYFVIMTYDYTMPGNITAGPNSPLRGSGDLFEHDIIKNVAEFVTIVPSRKLLLGIPLYGYEWDTVDTSKYSPATAKGTVASLERIQKMLDEHTLELVWDRNSLTPYGISTSSGQTTQIYFENDTSIRLKLEFVKSANLGGIAIWALGYEGNNQWLWPLLQTLNQ